MVGPYQLTLKVAVEMSMFGTNSVPTLFIRVSNPWARVPTRYNTLGWWFTIFLALCSRERVEYGLQSLIKYLMHIIMNLAYFVFCSSSFDLFLHYSLWST